MAKLSFFNIGVAGTMLAGVGMRFIGLDKSLWDDELHTLKVISSENSYDFLHTDYPPWYFLLLKLWSLINPAEAFLRALSAILGCLTLYFVFRWMRMFSKTAGLVSLALCACLPVLIRYSQELRFYPLLLCAVSATFFYVERLIHNPSERKTFLLFLFAIYVSVIVHPTGIFIPLTVLSYCFMRSQTRTVAEIRAHPGLAAAAFLGPLVLTLASHLVVFGLSLGKISVWWVKSWSWQNHLQELGKLSGIASFFGMPPMMPADLLADFFGPSTILLLSIAVIMWIVLFFGNWRNSLPFIVAFMVHTIQVIVFSKLILNVWVERYLLPQALLLVGFVGMQIASIANPWLKRASLVLLVVVCVRLSLHWVKYEAFSPFQDWKSFAKLVEANEHSGDRIIIVTSSPDSVSHYLGNPGRYIQRSLDDKLVVQDLLKAALMDDKRLTVYIGFGFKSVYKSNAPLVDKVSHIMGKGELFNLGQNLRVFKWEKESTDRNIP